MNVISLAVWTLEKNCFIIYTALIICFITFTLCHKNKLETLYRRAEEKKEKLARTGASKRDRNLPNNEDDDPDYTPAISEDTPHIPYQPDEEVLYGSRECYELMTKRRTVKRFSEEAIPREVLDNIVKTAGTAPSDAHTETWTFVFVQDKAIKEAIREIVEQEENLNYNQKMSRQWVTDIKPFATKPAKWYLSEAPALFLVFRQTHSWRKDGKKRMLY